MDKNSVAKEHKHKYIDNLSLLSIVNKDRDIKQGSYAIYPGPRCPLALVTNVFSNIKGVLTLVVGTAECTYYNKNISLMFKDGYEENTTWSYCIDPKELIFGCRDGIVEALCEMDKTGAEVILLVSACVPEMVGEDFEGIARHSSSIMNARVINIPASHFKCYSSVPTKMASLTSLYAIMEKQLVQKNTINLLGEASNLLVKSELIRILQKHGISINCTVPNNLTIDILRKAPSAALSIVTDLAALPLAKKMYVNFGTPYVLFPHLLDPKEIRQAYYEIADNLNISIEEEIESLFEKTQNQIDLYAYKVKGRSFISGYLSLDPFIFSAFLSSLQMKPEYIEVEYFFDENKLWRNKILDIGYNPYVGRTFNSNTTRYMLNSTFVDYYFGYNMAQEPEKNSILFIKYDAISSELGFEQPLSLLKNIIGKEMK
jgi:nitrogenase molybdenum-cofactor synthesis protein NifE